MAGKHDGRVVIVTGGGGGIGAATCDAFARDGAKVAVLDIDEGLAEEAAEHSRALGAEARAYRVDVTSSGDVDAVFAQVHRELGGIDVLVNSAGVSHVGDHTQDLSDEIWDLTIAVMQTGYFFCTRAAGRVMLEQRSGSVIHISSIRGFSPNPGRIGYCATKAAVIMMTRVMAAEWAPYGIRVNAIAPGVTKTPMWDADVARGALDEPRILENVPMHRLCTPAEIGRVATFLASDDAAYITGAVIVIDGGTTLIPRV